MNNMRQHLCGGVRKKQGLPSRALIAVTTSFPSMIIWKCAPMRPNKPCSESGSLRLSGKSMLKAIVVSVVSRLIILGLVLAAVNIYAGTQLFGKDGLFLQVKTALASLNEINAAIK